MKIPTRSLQETNGSAYLSKHWNRLFYLLSLHSSWSLPVILSAHGLTCKSIIQFFTIKNRIFKCYRMLQSFIMFDLFILHVWFLYSHWHNKLSFIEELSGQMVPSEILIDVPGWPTQQRASVLRCYFESDDDHIHYPSSH